MKTSCTTTLKSNGTNETFNPDCSLQDQDKCPRDKEVVSETSFRIVSSRRRNSGGTSFRCSGFSSGPCELGPSGSRPHGSDPSDSDSSDSETSSLRPSGSFGTGPHGFDPSGSNSGDLGPSGSSSPGPNGSEPSDPSTPSSLSDSSSNSSGSSSSRLSSSSSSESQDDSDPDDRDYYRALIEKYSLDEKVFDANGKTRTKIDFLLMALCKALRHNLSDVAVEDLLKSYNCILGKNVIPSSSYMFNKIFACDSGIEYHFCCSNCERYLGTKSELLDKAGEELAVECTVCQFSCNISTMNNGHFFIVLPLKNQLKCFLESQPNIDDLLAYRFRREPSNDVRDIFDGDYYKELSKPGGILCDQNNVSVTLFTDGAKVFLSGGDSMWVVMCRLNELPPDIRFDVDNMFYTAFCFGKPPNMDAYLSQYVLESRSLYSEGFEWKKGDEKVRTKVVTPLICVDLCAKCKVQKRIQFNGRFSCSMCDHPGDLVNLTDDVIVEPAAAGVADVVDDFSESDSDFQEDGTEGQGVTQTRSKKIVKQIRYCFWPGLHPDRTDEQCRLDMIESEGTGTNVRGALGVPIVSLLNDFHLVDSFPIDFMHSCLIGTMSHLLNLWLNPKFSKKAFSVRNKMPEINERLLNLKLPLNLYKRFESLEKYGTFKANMLELLLFYLGVVCFQGILPDIYLKHFALFVASIYKLSSDCISQTELNNCEVWLLKFVEDFQNFYGPSEMVHNVHLSLHLVRRCVRNFGPLFCFSAFGFESANGWLKKLVRGTRGVQTQLARKYSTIRFLPKILASVQITEDVQEFCDYILVLTKRSKEATKFAGVTLLGEGSFEPLTDEESQLLERASLPKESICYQRMIFNGIKYHSAMYKRQGKKTFDGGVFLKDETYGIIRRILVWENRVFMMIRNIDIEPNLPIVTNSSTTPPCQVTHIKVCKLYPYGELRLVRATEVYSKCIVLKTALGTYVTVPPNMYHKD